MQDFTQFIANHPALFLAAALLFVALMVVEFIRARRNVFNLSPTQATQMINHENAAIVDIRPNDIFRKGHIIDALSMSAQELREDNKKKEKLRLRPLIIVCNTGIESQKLASILLKQGYNAYSLSGGMRAWLDAQMPVVKD